MSEVVTVLVVLLCVGIIVAEHNRQAKNADSENQESS